MQQLMQTKGKKISWTDEAHVSFENIKRELCEASFFGMPTEKGLFVLETYASLVVISCILHILHQEQEWNGRTVLRPKAYGSKVLSDTEMKYGAPKVAAPLKKIQCVKMMNDVHAPETISGQLNAMRTYLKARLRLSDLLPTIQTRTVLTIAQNRKWNSNLKWRRCMRKN